MNALVRILGLPACCLSKVPGLGPLVRAAATTVGQKIVMAITGLALCGFLVVHLAGNLNLYAGEEKFNKYAEALHSLGPLLAVAEIGLFAMFAGHLGLAISTTAMNRAARSSRYAVRETKQGVFALPNGGASSWMLVTGCLVLVFLVMHIADMKLKINPLVDYGPALQTVDGQTTVNSFRAVRRVLSTPVNACVYFVGIFALGIHLTHGFRSAFHSLGLNHPRWDGLLRLVSLLFGWVIAAGFISLIVWAFAAPR